MTDPLPPTSAENLPALPVPVATEIAATAPPATPPIWRQPLFWLAVVALGLAGWQWTETRQRLLQTQEEVARRLADADAQARETRTLARQAQELTAAMQTRVGVLEARLVESQSQQAALEALYQELARGRDEWTLAEIEQLLALAAQQLQLAGNVQAAVLALGNADARLARADRPQFLALRKTIARDLAKLRALPAVDVTGISVRLESVVTGSDTLALAFEERPRPTARAVTAPAAATPGTAAASPLALVDAWWSRLGDDLWREIRGLVRIERFDRPEPALLSPSHAFFLRENLKLRLLNARLALLARDQGTFRGEVRQALAWLERHFDGNDKAVQTALATLRPLAAADLQVELPNLNDSLSALRTVRLGRQDAKP